ncbi:hypothetical protein [Pseudomonas pergaminensis]
MSDDNKAAFNGCAGDVLRLLVLACPLPKAITADTFSLPKGNYTSSGGFVGGFYNPTPEEELLDSTLEWLVAEGFVRKIGSDSYVATLQTLKIYNAVPNAFSDQ